VLHRPRVSRPELALVCEFEGGLVRRLTAYAAREEALRAAEELAAA